MKLDSAAVLSVWLFLLSPARGEQPVNCRWSDYGPWSECDPCSSTKVRIRRIQVFAQFGGALCSGASFDVQPCSSHKQCPLQDGCGGRFRCSSGQCISTTLLCNGDQDCEDGLDEARCESSYYSCDTQKTPPNSDLTGRGYNTLTKEMKASVINTRSFGGQCRKVYTAQGGTHYRLPQNVLTYNLQVAVNNEESDESYESSWSYMKHVQTNALFTNYKQTFHHELSENKAYRLIILKNRVVLGHFINSAPAYLTLSEGFWRALASLPLTYDYAAYSRVLHTYGTHYLSEGSLGGQYSALLQLDRHTMESTSTTDIEYQRCWRKVKRRLFRKKVTVTCERLTQALASKDGFQRSSMPIKVNIVGGDVSLIGALSVLDLENPEQNGEHYDNWAASVQDFPELIEPKLRPLYELVKEVPCSGLKKLYLRRALEHFLSEQDPCHCRPCHNNGAPLVTGTQCTCVCRPGTSGPACEGGSVIGEQPGVVHGGWSCWSTWSPCSGGQRSRTRSCSNPAPRGGGIQCIGASIERGPCEDPDMEYLKLMEPQCLGLSVPPPKMCPPPPPLTNGFVRSPKDMYLVGDTVEFSCIHGYHLHGGAVTTCTEQETWKTESMHCEVSVCAAPELQPDIRASPLKHSYEMGESVSLSCPPGLDLDGDVSHSMCSSSLQWSPSPKDTRCKPESTAPPPPSGLLCALWEKTGHRGCVCKMPTQCPPSLPLCADLGPFKQTLGVCQLGALRCLGRNFTLLSDNQCTWAEPSCRGCEPGTRCDKSSDKCVCQRISECPPNSTPLCVKYGSSDVAVTTSECEVGARRCAGETVHVISIEACPGR
ncbi:complement component 7b [Periophthalmus magnuspinnatus]|uniref:complement component 7b n=1 Tax=Periophthalmus magnuspinnatus TaxID=409849 RepID=UPI00145A0DEA|nr:complement component 7b [Periophthalmus magnuspinnatus]